MASEPKEETIGTLAHLMSVVPAGGAVSLLFEDDSLSFQLLPKILHSLQDEKLVRLFTTRTDDPVLRARRRLEVVNLSNIRNLQEVKRLMLRQLKVARRGDIVMFDLAISRRFSPKAISGFREEVTRNLLKRKQASIWLLPSEPAVFGSLMEARSPGVVARLWTAGNPQQPCFQILHSSESASPDVFVPRLLREI